MNSVTQTLSAIQKGLRRTALWTVAGVLLVGAVVTIWEAVAANEATTDSAVKENEADTVDAIYSLAASNLKAGHYAEALKLHQEVLGLRKEKLGPDAFQTLLSMWGVAIAMEKLGRTADAIPIIDECLKRAAGKKFRSDFFGLADIRLRYFEKKQDGAGCRTSAELLESTPPTTAIGFYHAACFRAVTANVISATDKSPAGVQNSEDEAKRAIAWLEKSINAGFKDVASLKKDPDLASLQGRADFQKLVSKLEAGVK
jgi:tetratricopeptide (TPR) repeat protein